MVHSETLTQFILKEFPKPATTFNEYPCMLWLLAALNPCSRDNPLLGDDGMKQCGVDTIRTFHRLHQSQSDVQMPVERVKSTPLSTTCALEDMFRPPTATRVISRTAFSDLEEEIADYNSRYFRRQGQGTANGNAPLPIPATAQDFWWQQKSSYPILYDLYRRYTPFQPTSAESERIFSRAGLRFKALRCGRYCTG